MPKHIVEVAGNHLFLNGDDGSTPWSRPQLSLTRSCVCERILLKHTKV